MRVLLVDKLASTIVERLEAAGCAVTEEIGIKGEALTARLAAINPQVVVVRSTKLAKEQLLAAPDLSLVIRAGAGVDTIDVKLASERGIYVANCPGKNAIAVAELTMGLLISLDRRIPDNVIALRAHAWKKSEFSKARGLYGRTLAVLGTGDIGKAVISRAQAFGMVVRAWSRSLSREAAEAMGVTWCATPREACKGADALTIHVASNASTKGLVSRELLEALRPGAFVLNTSRGDVVDEAALRELMATRGLRAGLDVFQNEPAKDGAFDSAILDEAGLYGTHHIGASTDQASDAVADEVVRIIEGYVQSGNVLNVVNLESAPPATHLLVVRHADRVGVLASVLGTLREAGVSVQEMENIIFKGAAAASARIQLDRAPAPEHLEQIRAHADIFSATLVALESAR